MIVDGLQWVHPVANKNTEMNQAVDFLVGSNMSIGIGGGEDV